MKNIIAIASLLAAGTAFANAETIDWTALNFSLISVDKAGNRLSPFSDPLTSGNTGFAWTGQSSLDIWKIEFTLSGTPAVSNRIFSTRSVSSDGQTSTKWQLYFSATDKLNFGYNSGNGAPTSSSLVDTAGLSYTAGDKVTLQFVKNSDGSSGTFTLSVGNASSTATVTTNLSTATFVPTPTSGTDFSRIWTNSGKSTFSGIKLYSGAIVIPEPSAFGLLAGVGALALVAARRRRRAK